MRFSAGAVGLDEDTTQPAAVEANNATGESNVGAKSRSPVRSSRRGAAEPTQPDHSQPGFSSLAARLGVDLSLLATDTPDGVSGPASEMERSAR